MLYNATIYRNEAGEVQGVFAAARDITERKQTERRQEFTNALLALFAQKATANEYLDALAGVIRQWTGCQSLGVRLLTEEEEIPYETWSGFEPRFLDLERRLSVRHDSCLCTRAVTQVFEESDGSLLTPGGSVRSDDAIAFLKGVAPEKQASYRGNCMKFGFASLAIIPIRYRKEIVGVIHLADLRPGQFPGAMVEFIESMTPLIGEAIHRFRTKAELTKHRDHLEVLVKQRTGELEAANARLQVEVAERKQAQETLQRMAEDLGRSNRDLEQFAYVASHDLQEPLRAVGGYAKLLERRFSGKLDAKGLEYIAGATDGAARMERLITDLLAFSRVGTRGGRGGNGYERAVGRGPEKPAGGHSGGPAQGEQRAAAHPAGGPDTDDAAFPEPDRQRHQVPGRTPAGNPCRRPPGQGPLGLFGAGQRHWHRAAVFRAHFPDLPASAHAQTVPGHGHRAGHLQEDRRAPRRRDLGRVPAGTRVDFLLLNPPNPWYKQY